MAGKPACSAPGGQQKSRDYKGPRFHRRGEGGEGRERGQVCFRRDLFPIVQVFSGYIASLSKTIRQKTTFKERP